MLAFNPLASIFVALGVCTRQGRSAVGPMANWLPERPSVEQSLDVTKAEHGSGQIDDPADLADERVWLLVGANDEVVPWTTLEVLSDYYLALALYATAANDQLRQRSTWSLESGITLCTAAVQFQGSRWSNLADRGRG